MPFQCELNLDCLLSVGSFQLFMNTIRYYPLAGLAFLLIYFWRKDYFQKFRIQSKDPVRSKIVFEIRQSAVTLFVFSLIGFSVFVLSRVGILKRNLYGDPDMYGGIPYLIFSFVLVTIWHETWFYWAHRIMHHRKIYSWVHLTHHKSVNPSPLAAYNFSFTEAIFEALYLPIFVQIVPMYFPLLIFHTFYAMILNIYFHSGIELYPKGFTDHPVFKWINTSTHHNLHHQKFNGNYSLYFNFWDRIMGTNFPYYEESFEEVVRKKESFVLNKNTIIQ
ncbi:MAG: sterol desaturase family protein [Leptospiraceae bacterium]|nr:sterol desaturase family protein [Leptospiraceae bacterium]MCP5510729.1 sterol desaturase family protein [Leptospiraceae bacterium]